MKRKIITDKNHDLEPYRYAELISLLDSGKVVVNYNHYNYDLFVKEKESGKVVAEFICDKPSFRFCIIYKQRKVFSGAGPVYFMSKNTPPPETTYPTFGNALYTKARNLRYNHTR